MFTNFSPQPESKVNRSNFILVDQNFIWWHNIINACEYVLAKYLFVGYLDMFHHNLV